MSTMIDSVSTPQVARQPSKKRKIETDAPTKSKKKRKQSEPSNETLLPSSQPVSTKEKKSKKKKQPDEEILVTPARAQAIEDIELPDAPATDVVATIETLEDEDQIQLETIEEVDDTLMKSTDLSCFYSMRISLYVPLPAISQSSSTSSLLSLHLAPLLLTYFPPVEGIVLSFSDPVLSAKADTGVNLPLRAPRSGQIPRNPPDETFVRCADWFGVCWVWLTATFLVFKPQSGDELKAWTNVQSEGFVGLVSYNYFQTAVGKERIPKEWIWDGPTGEHAKKRRTPKKSRLRDEGGETPVEDDPEFSQTNEARDDDAINGGSGSFIGTDGKRISGGQTFKVVDVEMVPGPEKDRWTLQIDGSLLSKEQEAIAVAEDKRRFDAQHRSRSRSKTPGFEEGDLPLMSGGLGLI